MGGKGNCEMKKVDPADDFAKVLAASPALNIQVWDVEVPNVGVAAFVIQDDGTNVVPVMFRDARTMDNIVVYSTVTLGVTSVPPLATLIPDPCVQLSAVGK